MELGKFGRLGAITPAKILAAMIRKGDDWLSHLLSTVSRPVVAPLGTGPSGPIFFWMLKPYIGGVVSRTYGRGWFRPVLDAVPATGFIMSAWQSGFWCLANSPRLGAVGPTLRSLIYFELPVPRWQPLFLLANLCTEQLG